MIVIIIKLAQNYRRQMKSGISILITSRDTPLLLLMAENASVDEKSLAFARLSDTINLFWIMTQTPWKIVIEPFLELYRYIRNVTKETEQKINLYYRELILMYGYEVLTITRLMHKKIEAEEI